MPSDLVDASTRRVGKSPPSMTVIVQGPVNHPEANWDRCIDSIHRNIPHAKVLAVQWLGDSRAVNAPRLLLEDPGTSISENGYVSNLWRRSLVSALLWSLSKPSLF